MRKQQVKKIYKFYDTSSLLLAQNNLFKDENIRVVISSITLNELEHIKTSQNKDSNIKFTARFLLNLLDQNPDSYELWIYKNSMIDEIISKDLEVTNDTKILATAIDYDKKVHPDELIFVTNDLALKNIANLFFGSDSIESVIIDNNNYYSGYLEVEMSEDELIYFYSHPFENTYNLLINQYIIVKEKNNPIPVDQLCWTGSTYRKIEYNRINSKYFGEIKAFKGDIYQALLIDSFFHNKITMVHGPAGTGKTYLSLAFLLHQLEKNKISKIVIFCNPIATKNSAKLGYYPGTRDEKLLDSQIGNLLISKFGGRYIIEELIAQEKLILLPLSDIRGYDTSGMNAGIYISEAQNMDINAMKLTLQRIGEDSFCIIDGDFKAQVDDIEFEGSNNGMKRASIVFRNSDIYGQIELKNIHRSKIAEIAEKM